MELILFPTSASDRFGLPGVECADGEPVPGASDVEWRVGAIRRWETVLETGALVPVVSGSTLNLFPSEVRCQGVLAQLGKTPGRQAIHRGFEPRRSRILAAYICKRCEIEGQDLEVSPGRVFCWNCEDEAVITARIALQGA